MFSSNSFSTMKQGHENLLILGRGFQPDWLILDTAVIYLLCVWFYLFINVLWESVL